MQVKSEPPAGRTAGALVVYEIGAIHFTWPGQFTPVSEKKN